MIERSEQSKPSPWVLWAAVLRGVVAGTGFVLCVAGAVLALACLQLRHADPLNSPARLEAIRAAQQSPNDTEVVMRARELDLLARRAFFAQQYLVRRGGWILWIGAALLFGALSGTRWLEPRVVVPVLNTSPEERVERERHAAQRALTLYMGLLVGGAVAVGLVLRTPAPAVSAPLHTPSVADEPPPEPTFAAVQGEEPLDDLLAQAWPAFRGYGGRGGVTSPAPTRWNLETGEGVLWKVEVPRRAFSSPIVWSNFVFVTGADSRYGSIYCFDAQRGQLLWEHEARDVPGSPPTPPKVSEDTGLAAPTPATDGRRVFAVFATGDLVACDLSGHRLWARNLGVPKNPYGHASSLQVYRGRLIVQYDQETGGRLLALDPRTGNTIWDVPRDVKAGWSTPIIWTTEGRGLAAVLANPKLIAHDLETGRAVWQVEHLEAEIGTSPATDGERVFAGNEYARLVAVSAADGQELWSSDEDLPDVASPLAWNGCLFTATSGGIVTCRDGTDGRRLWMQEWDEGFYSSPVAAADAVYLIDRKGLARVVRAARTFELITENPCGDACGATPAIAHGRLYLRTARFLAAITGVPPAESASGNSSAP